MSGFDDGLTRPRPPSVEEMLWDAIPGERRSRSHDWDVSLPDYATDFVSWGDDWYADTAMSHPGPEYWTEKRQAETDWRIAAADRVGADCRREAERRAEDRCVDRILPNGVQDKRISPAECMRFWADGMPDDIVTASTAYETRRGSSHELALEGEIGATIDGNGVKGKGALRKTGSEETSKTDTRTRSMTRRGHEGYVRECADMEHDWYMERLKTMQPYGD